jgi:hypothetical protein
VLQVFRLGLRRTISWELRRTTSLGPLKCSKCQKVARKGPQRAQKVLTLGPQTPPSLGPQKTTTLGPQKTSLFGPQLEVPGGACLGPQNCSETVPRLCVRAQSLYYMGIQGQPGGGGGGSQGRASPDSPPQPTPPSPRASKVTPPLPKGIPKGRPNGAPKAPKTSLWGGARNEPETSPNRGWPGMPRIDVFGPTARNPTFGRVQKRLWCSFL